MDSFELQKIIIDPMNSDLSILYNPPDSYHKCINKNDIIKSNVKDSEITLVCREYINKRNSRLPILYINPDIETSRNLVNLLITLSLYEDGKGNCIECNNEFTRLHQILVLTINNLNHETIKKLENLQFEFNLLRKEIEEKDLVIANLLGKISNE